MGIEEWEKVEDENKYEIELGSWRFEISWMRSGKPGCTRYEFQLYQPNIPQTAAGVKIDVEDSSLMIKEYKGNHPSAPDRLKTHSHLLSAFPGIPEDERSKLVSIINQLAI